VAFLSSCGALLAMLARVFVVFFLLASILGGGPSNSAIWQIGRAEDVRGLESLFISLSSSFFWCVL